jgi:hypothetical protein
MTTDSLTRRAIAMLVLIALSSSWLPSLAHATHLLSVPASLCVQSGGDWRVVGSSDGGDVYACVARHTSPAPTPTITPVSVPVPSSVGTMPKPTLSAVPLPVITVNGVNDESRYRLQIQVAGIAQSYAFTDRRTKPMCVRFMKYTATTMKAVLYHDTEILAVGPPIGINGTVRWSALTAGLGTPWQTSSFQANLSTKACLFPHGAQQTVGWVKPSIRAAQAKQDAQLVQILSAGAVFWAGLDVSMFQRARPKFFPALQATLRPSMVLYVGHNGKLLQDVMQVAVDHLAGSAEHFMLFKAMLAEQVSVMEAASIQRATGRPAVSTQRVLATARARGIAVVVLKTPSDITKATIPSVVDRNDIIRYLQGGAQVVLPVIPLSVGAWSGTAYEVFQIRGLYAVDYGSFLSGGIRGGAGQFGTAGFQSEGVVGLGIAGVTATVTGSDLAVAGLTFAATGGLGASAPGLGPSLATALAGGFVAAIGLSAIAAGVFMIVLAFRAQPPAPTTTNIVLNTTGRAAGVDVDAGPTEPATPGAVPPGTVSVGPITVTDLGTGQSVSEGGSGGTGPTGPGSSSSGVPGGADNSPSDSGSTSDGSAGPGPSGGGGSSGDSGVGDE